MKNYSINTNVSCPQLDGSESEIIEIIEKHADGCCRPDITDLLRMQSASQLPENPADHAEFYGDHIFAPLGQVYWEAGESLDDMCLQDGLWAFRSYDDGCRNKYFNANPYVRNTDGTWSHAIKYSVLRTDHNRDTTLKLLFGLPLSVVAVIAGVNDDVDVIVSAEIMSAEEDDLWSLLLHFGIRADSPSKPVMMPGHYCPESDTWQRLMYFNNQGTTISGQPWSREALYNQLDLLSAAVRWSEDQGGVHHEF